MVLIARIGPCLLAALLVVAWPARAVAWPGQAAAPPPAPGPSQAALTIQRTLEALQLAGRLSIGGEVIARSTNLFELYRRRGFEPLWTGRGGVDDLLATIGDADAQGLDPMNYHGRVLHERRIESGAAEIAARDLLMTDALVQIAHDVRYGRACPDPPPSTGIVPPDVADGAEPASVAGETDPSSVTGGTDPAAGAAEPGSVTGANVTGGTLPPGVPEGPDPVAELQDAIYGGRVRELVASLEPQNTPYRRLKLALASYREIQRDGGWRTIAAGPSPQIGQRDPRVAALRDRLIATGDLPQTWPRKEGDVYDKTLRDGVRAFQSRHGLTADGALGAQTLAALNVPVQSRIDQIRATLERSRWFLHDLPGRYVMVNVAGFRVSVIDNDEVIWRARVIVGERDKETPMFRADMRSVVLNPTWSVPPSIVRNEFLPGLKKDPRYLARRHIVRVGDDYVQAAGKDNALGRIKLLLPNPYSVYLHDTPTKSLFDRATRTFSHGCVRVEHPVELASLALDDPAWSVAALNRAIATGKTRTIVLRNPVPVFVLYWSVTVGRDGSVEFLPDVYDRDAEVLRGLGRSAPLREKVPASA